MKLDISLYVLVDPAVARGKPLAALAAAAARGGATLVQLRDKGGTTQRLIEEAIAIKRALRGFGVPLIVNDRADVALAAGADGIHLGRDDLDPATARRLLGPRAIIGASVKNEADVGAVIDVELHQQIVIAGGRVDFGGDLGVGEAAGDLVGLAELALDLNEERGHRAPLHRAD